MKTAIAIIITAAILLTASTSNIPADSLLGIGLAIAILIAPLGAISTIKTK